MSDVIDELEKDLDSIARTVTYRPDARMTEFQGLPLSEKSAVFHLLSSRVQQEVLSELNFGDALELLDHMDPARVHHVLSKTKDKKRRERFIGRLKSDRFEKSEYFLQFHPEATLSLFHVNYLYLPETATVGDAAADIENHLRQTGKVPVILVNKNGVLSGEVPLSTLVRERNSSKLKNFVRPSKVLQYNIAKQEIIPYFSAAPHEKVVVTDQDGSVLGLVYSDDVMDLLDAQPATTLYSFAGVEASERPFDGVMDKVKGRYRWLIINLVTCFMAGGVVSLFNGTIDKFVTLAVFLPIIAGMGGNASTQTLAVMIRGIAVGEINLKNSYPAISREVLAGFINGLITGVAVVPVAMIFGVSVWIALIAAVAVIFNLVVAGFFGSVTPLILKRLGKDPATSAGIFISTATDVLGLMFFLGVATIFLL